MPVFPMCGIPPIAFQAAYLLVREQGVVPFPLLSGFFNPSFRFVLADTEQLHRKITEMGRRIRELEDALALLQAGISNEPHPLLTQDLLSIKHGPEIRNQEDEVNQGSGVETLDALGTLHISEGGEATYFGRSAGSEVRPLNSEIYPIF